MATSAPTRAARRRPGPPPPTLVLLVRHGTTPSTGKVLPGRARGLHLSEEGRRQADALAARLSDWALETSRRKPAGGGRSDRPGSPRSTGGGISAVYSS